MQAADVAEPPAGAGRPWAPLALRRGVPLRRRLLHGLQSSLGATGIAEAYVRTRRPVGAMILMYHSVAAAEDAQWIDPQNHMPPEVFERHMRLLAERRRVIALDELVDCVARGQTPPAGTVVITFDDGYRDNLTVAAPILARYGLPATLFLATGYVSRGQSQWIDELYGVFRTRTRPSLTLGGRAWRLDSGTAAWDAYQAVAGELLIADYAARQALLEAVAGQLEPVGRPPRLTMDWDDVRAWMAASPGLSVGLHTRDHVDLTARGEDDARAELAACMADTDRELGSRGWHFSFPYSRATPALQGLARAAGMWSAAAAERAELVGAGSDAFALPRVQAPASLARLKYVTSGAHPALSLALVRRA